MLYCITYDIRNTAHEEAFIKQLKELGENNQFISNCWFLDSTKSKEEIYNILKGTLDSPDLLFICQTNLGKMSGWLPSDSVNWLKEHST